MELLISSFNPVITWKPTKLDINQCRWEMDYCQPTYEFPWNIAGLRARGWKEIAKSISSCKPNRRTITYPSKSSAKRGKYRSREESEGKGTSVLLGGEQWRKENDRPRSPSLLLLLRTIDGRWNALASGSSLAGYFYSQSETVREEIRRISNDDFAQPV